MLTHFVQKPRIRAWSRAFVRAALILHCTYQHLVPCENRRNDGHAQEDRSRDSGSLYLSSSIERQ
jgi:hypothetical protein